MIGVGTRVRDEISGFEGIAVGRTEWLYGCVRIGVAPEKLDKDGRVTPPEWFDEAQLLTLEPAVKRPALATGGRLPAPTGGPARESDPGR